MYREKIARVALSTSLFLISAWASAENQFSLYSGTAHARSSELRVSQGGNTGLSLRGVEWSADPFRSAPYYGLRFTHFYDRSPNWGLGVDLSHYKMHGDIDRGIDTPGQWRTAAQESTGAGAYGQRFDIAHGTNVLSINGIYRWGDLKNPGRRLHPYVGAGLAYYRPHTENTASSLDHDSGYESSGFGYHLLGGLRYRFTDTLGAFVEAKFNSANTQAGVANSDTETSLRSFHAVAGVNYSF